jgi:tryptophan 2,3-dioxygenase
MAGERPAGGLVETLSYDRYLRLADLLAIQHPRSAPPAHDELMFIIAHQAYELWFRLLLHELTAARDAMLAGEVYPPQQAFERCRVVERLLVDQIDLLDTLSPARFLEFRSAVSPASGFESVQYREIEFLSGNKDSRYLRALSGVGAAEHDRLRARLAEPTLWDGFLAVLAAAGLPVAEPAARREALLLLARGTPAYRDLWRLAEGLLDHDQAWSLWRGRHALLVERQIGSKVGTGGSTGVSYLRSRAYDHFYPELWEVRSQL